MSPQWQSRRAPERARWAQDLPRRWSLVDRLPFIGIWVGGFLIVWMLGRLLWAML
jgi:hypothetical protein